MDSSVSLNLVSLNIEGDKHFDRLLPFLAGRSPDAFCVQEVFERDVPKISDAIGRDSLFVPLTRHQRNDTPERWGILIASALPFRASGSAYYYGTAHPLPEYARGDTTRIHRAVAWATVEKEGVPFTVATTHFTWTPDGQADEHQRRDLPQLLKALEGLPEFILTGDFNAPRGREIFAAIAKKYKDNIPPQYTTSLDPDLHRAGPLPYMVDGLFSTSHYAVEDVELLTGLSDHCAVVARVRKADA